ncbi:MAG: tetratricopeptide repeat protein [Vicinamibacteria bacterium]
MSFRLLLALLLTQGGSLLDQGRRFLEERNLPAAERVFRGLVAQNPEDSRANYFLGLTLSRQNRTEEAIFVLEKARDSATRPNPTILFELGTAYSREKRWKEAEEALQMATELAPAEIGMRLQLGWVYYSSVQGEKARAEFEKVIETSPSAPAWLYLGLTEIGLGENEPAIRALGEALALAPDLLEAQLALGKTLARAGRDEEAKPVLLRALEIDAGAAEAHFQLGLVALRSGNPEAARTAFREAVEAEGDHMQAWYNLALVAERLGRGEEARSAWKRVEDLRASGAWEPEAARRTRAKNP